MNRRPQPPDDTNPDPELMTPRRLAAQLEAVYLEVSRAAGRVEGAGAYLGARKATVARIVEELQGTGRLISLLRGEVLAGKAHIASGRDDRSLAERYPLVAAIEAKNGHGGAPDPAPGPGAAAGGYRWNEHGACVNPEEVPVLGMTGPGRCAFEARVALAPDGTWRAGGTFRSPLGGSGSQPGLAGERFLTRGAAVLHACRCGVDRFREEGQDEAAEAVIRFLDALPGEPSELDIYPDGPHPVQPRPGHLIVGTTAVPVTGGHGMEDDAPKKKVRFRSYDVFHAPDGDAGEFLGTVTAGSKDAARATAKAQWPRKLAYAWGEIVVKATPKSVRERDKANAAANGEGGAP